MVTGNPIEFKIGGCGLAVLVGLYHRSAGYGGVMPVWIADSHIED